MTEENPVTIPVEQREREVIITRVFDAARARVQCVHRSTSDTRIVGKRVTTNADEMDVRFGGFW
jgi:hypothetical protein